MQDELNHFKKELQRLEGKQVEAHVPSTGASPAGIFDKFLEEDKHRDLYVEETERVSAINKQEKACPSCYRRQPHENETCRLCKERPEKWLPAYESTIRKAGGLDEAAIQRNLHKWLSTSATVNHLQQLVAMNSLGDWKVKHAARILRLLGENVPLDFHGQPVDAGDLRTPTPETQDKPGITDAQITAANRWYDLQLEKLKVAQDELRKQTGAE